MTDRLRSRALAPRDQAVSAFSTILMRLVDGTGALGAALVDAEGETVDYAGARDVFSMKVAAAEWRLVLRFLADSTIPHWEDTREVLVRGSNKSFGIVALTEGYALVLELRPRSFAVSSRAVAEAVGEIRIESGLTFADPRRAGERWVGVEVRTEAADHRRPAAVWVEGAWMSVEILGSYRLGRRELGFRARLASGGEVTLVREPLGRWYADVIPTLQSLPPSELAPE